VLTGQAALVADLNLPVRRPHTESRILGARRRTETGENGTVETYSKAYAHAGGFRDHLLFALRHEPLDLGVLCATFKAVGPGEIRTWMEQEPTGSYARRAWFFYEYLTGERLDWPDVKSGNYVDALDSKRHIVADSRPSRRHRVRDNLLGVPGFSPTVRRTKRLSRDMEAALDQQATALTRDVDPELLRRAASFLYTKETKSTWAIEGEEVSGGREEKFVTALTRAAKFDTSSKGALIALQNAIVDPRYAASDWRDVQNYVGETIGGYRERVHFVCPRPEDVAALMGAWGAMSERLVAEHVDPVIGAALVAFGFVFVHPFEDGNGRIHRFLVHNVLSRTGFSPAGVIFPVSVSIVRDMAAYDAALESFAKPLLSLIDWEFFEDEQRVLVRGSTADHYRYFDATPLAEYLYGRVAETVRKDLAEELDFLSRFDLAYEGVRGVVDMPNKKVSLFVRLALQNGGRLPKVRRKHFDELNEAEIAAMEAAVQRAQKRTGEDALEDTRSSVPHEEGPGD
jgi:hypothetical protein